MRVSEHVSVFAAGDVLTIDFGDRGPGVFDGEHVIFTVSLTGEWT